jgi:hypothetical protein
MRRRKAATSESTTSPSSGVLWGVGTDPNTSTASLRAVLNAHERSLR